MAAVLGRAWLRLGWRRWAGDLPRVTVTRGGCVQGSRMSPVRKLLGAQRKSGRCQPGTHGGLPAGGSLAGGLQQVESGWGRWVLNRGNGWSRHNGHTMAWAHKGLGTHLKGCGFYFALTLGGGLGQVLISSMSPTMREDGLVRLKKGSLVLKTMEVKRPSIDS